MIGWVALVIGLLNWISESPSQKNLSATPAYLSFGMSGKHSLPTLMNEADLACSDGCWCGMYNGAG